MVIAQTVGFFKWLWRKNHSIDNLCHRWIFLASKESKNGEKIFMLRSLLIVVFGFSSLISHASEPLVTCINQSDGTWFYLHDSVDPSGTAVWFIQWKQPGDGGPYELQLKNSAFYSLHPKLVFFSTWNNKNLVLVHVSTADGKTTLVDLALPGFSTKGPTNSFHCSRRNNSPKR